MLLGRNLCGGLFALGATMLLCASTGYANDPNIFVPWRHRHLEDLINAGVKVIGTKKDCQKVEDAFPSASTGSIDNPVVVVVCSFNGKISNFPISKNEIEKTLKRKFDLPSPVSEQTAIQSCLKWSIGSGDTGRLDPEKGHVEFFHARPMLRLDGLMLVQIEYRTVNPLGTGLQVLTEQDCLVRPDGAPEFRPRSSLITEEAAKLDLRNK